jgi:shikimate dehydrogenase
MVDGNAPKQAFVAGFPIGHSRSPLIHNAWLRRYGLSGAYRAVEVAPDAFGDFVASLRRPDASYCGGNVTIPHKEKAFALADRVDPLTEELGAANTLWVEDGKVLATNTDGYGFSANLDERHPAWCSRRGIAVVFGAGGASRAVIQAVRERGFREIHVINRTVERAKALAERFDSCVFAGGIDAMEEVMKGADLFVNTTSLGMKGGAAPSIDFTLLDPAATVTDIVYVPLETPFLKAAKACGLATVDGLGMLLHQAVPGFEKWFGVRPEVTEDLRRLVIADMECPA